MHEYHVGIVDESFPYEDSELEYLRRRRVQRHAKADYSRENLFPMPSCIRLCSNWKFWVVLISLACIICIIFIVIWINWTRSRSGNVWGDEGPLGPEQPPAVCYKCSNYAHIMDGRELNSNIDIERGEGGGAEVGGALGIAVEIEGPRQELCQEVVNRTALAETQVLSNDDCGDSLYNGCFKMITKTYRMTSNIGHELLSVTIVTRNCVEIPKGFPLGCYKTFGGGGMERETCYCKGNYCNSALPLHSSLLLHLFLFTLAKLFR
ncbi:unnamed protein product [Rodentolepis nana]|uniref:DUF5746 domain-containing protein n=1 Tax=Rodentolepis nana TaxID=102285 RepID=A0A0R3TYK6_RODNA|nr:unnamed protein product [Rodentolepis nana]